MAAPWIKFYPTDWRADPALRVCSLAARGLWQEMLCVMHEATPYGYLVINGEPVPPKELAVLVGAPQREVESCLAELDKRRVYSRDENGVIYSRRMVRDHSKAEKDKANGKGGGNPSLKRGRGDGVNPSRAKKHERGLTPPLTHPPPGEDNAQSQSPDNPDPEIQTTQQPQNSEAAPARPKCAIRTAAFALAEELWQTAGFTKETLPPGWCGSPMAIDKWLEGGCPVEVIRFAVEGVLRRKKPDNFAYFDPVIATAFADHKRPLPTAFANHKRPLPTVVAKEGQIIEVSHANQFPHRRGAVQVALERLASLQDEAETDPGRDRDHAVGLSEG